MAGIKHRISLLLLFPFFAACYGQAKVQRLIAAEYRIDSTTAGDYTYLVAYNFRNGMLISKDTLLGKETIRAGIPGSYVRYDLGKNFIYQNRYVISGTGNVIDIKTKSLVIEESDNFVEAKGDTLVFHRNNIFSGTGFLHLNLPTKTYGFVNSKEWDSEKRESPDKKSFLTIDRSELPYKIILHHSAGQQETIVANAGTGPNITSGGQFPTIETYWLNNHSFLYGVHKTRGIDSTRFNPAQRYNSKFYSTITLRLFDIHTKKDEVFWVMDSVKQGDVNGRFYKDGIGQLIYRTSGRKSLLIDTAKKTLVDYPYYELGNDFSIANESTADGQTIHYKKTGIGKVWSSNEVVGTGIIAVEYGEPGSNLAYPKGLKVWSDATKTWTTIDIPWLCAAIGWIEGE